jgi:hypothetical protein
MIGFMLSALSSDCSQERTLEKWSLIWVDRTESDDWERMTIGGAIRFEVATAIRRNRL